MTPKKYFLLTIVATILPIAPLYAAIKVYSVDGTVSSRNGSEWVKLNKAAVLTEDQQIKINSASSIRLMDDANRRIYSLSTEGIHTVREIIAEAQRQNSSLTNKIIAEAGRRSAGASKSHHNVGAAHRATMSEEQLEAMYTALCQGLVAAENSGTLRAVLTPEADGMFSLQLYNDGDEDAYTNIFIRSAESPWQSLWSDHCVLIPAKSELTLNHEHYFFSDTDKLVLVSAADDFDTSELDAMFDENMEPEQKNAATIGLYFIQ